MIGAIPNPTKSIVIDFPIEKVKNAIVGIPKALKFTHFRESNEMFNTYTFARTEFLSMGALINVNLTEVTENKTQVNIEIARQLGAFDNWVEVSKANDHIQGFINALAHIIKNGVSEMPNQSQGAFITLLKVAGYGLLILIGLGLLGSLLK
jgi:hypothetical protein